MGKVMVSLSDETERKLRDLIKSKYGDKKGALSIVVEEAIKNYLKEKV